MVSSSPSPSSLYDVFPSFSGEDVRKTLLSHIHVFFESLLLLVLLLLLLLLLILLFFFLRCRSEIQRRICPQNLSLPHSCDFRTQSSSSSSSSSPSSSSSSYYDVFPSFSGEVRRTFLSHIHDVFEHKSIKTFKDQKIQRGQTIGLELIEAIRKSKISIVILSKSYASSSWCLNELLEIMNCRETAGQKVMTIFYEIDPSEVRKQTGDFGKAFERTCVGKTDEEKERWRKALTDVANIEGEDSRKWFVFSLYLMADAVILITTRYID